MRYLMLLILLTAGALPAAAVASPVRATAAGPLAGSGVLLRVSSERHLLRVVEGQRVDDVTFSRPLPDGATPGAKIGFTLAGRRASHLTVSSRVDHVVLFGLVVRVGKRLALRLTDGSLFPLPKGRHPKLGTTARAIVRFTTASSTAPGSAAAPATPGTTTSPSSPSGSGCAKSTCTFDVTGTVSAIDDTSGAVSVTPLTGGPAVTAQPGAINTDAVFIGDFVHISGTQSRSDGSYTMTVLDELPGCDTPDCTLSFDATVDAVDATSITVSDDSGDEYPISATAAQIATLAVADTVHIVAVQDPTTGDYRVKTVTVTGTGGTPQ